jgi:cyclohexa-1,5-dienecarbonyl-CoA hydratase
MADYSEDPHDLDVYAAPQAGELRFIQAVTAQGICRITLNRPPANVLSIEMMHEIAGVLEGLEYDKATRLVVLNAAGRYFSAGFEITDHLGDRAYLMLEGFRRIFDLLSKMDKPTLGVVSGAALGAGCMLAAGCDFVLAAQSVKLGFPETLGGVFNTVAAALLPAIVGRKKAFEMLLLGNSIAAADAERIGLVTKVVPDEAIEAEVAALVQRFQESSAPVVQCTRRAIAGGFDQPGPDAIRNAEDVYLNQLMATEDAEEGLRAILEKRKPTWKDR